MLDLKTLTPPADNPAAALVFFLLVFIVVGVVFLFFHLFMGKFLRPSVPDPEKLTIYECGEPAVGSAWIQFDLRFYVVALLFVIFDVEVAFFFPWAVVFGKANQLANLPAETQQVSADTKFTDLPRAEQDRRRLSAQLLPAGVSNDVKTKLGLVKRDAKTGVPEVIPIKPEAAAGWARVAFWDILVFFGVLLVGFAYLWRRGDLDWVRTVTHRGGENPMGQEAEEEVEEPRAVA